MPKEVVRAIMVLRVHDLSLGYSGCRMDTMAKVLKSGELVEAVEKEVGFLQGS